VNLSNKPKKLQLTQQVSGTYNSIFNKQVLSVFTNGEMTFDPYGYQVYQRID
jgi:hypothetical protein